MDDASRPIWRTALLRLQSQFSDAATRHPVIAAWLHHQGDDDPYFRADSPRNTDVCCGFHGTFDRHTPLALGPSGNSLFDDEITDDWMRKVLCLAATQQDESRNQACRHLNLVHAGGRTPEAEAASRLFASLAANAGRAVEMLPYVALQSLRFSSLTEDDLTKRWLWCVFDIAWSGRHPMLSAERRLTWVTDCRHYCPYDHATVKRVAEGYGRGVIPKKWVEALPDNFVSRIDDVFSASAAAIELLLSDADASSDEDRCETNPPTKRGRKKVTVEGGAGCDEHETMRRLLAVYSDGVSDERLSKAVVVLGSGLTVEEKMARWDAVMKIPIAASAQKIAEVIGCSDTAVKRTAWWKENRAGKKETEVHERGKLHATRSKLQLSDGGADDDD